MSIRLRLALSGVLVVGLVLLAFGVFFDLVVSRATPDEQRKSLAALAERTATVVRTAEASALEPRLPLLLDDPDEGTESFTAVLDRRGDVLFTDGQLSGVLEALPPGTLEAAQREGSGQATVALDSGTELELSLARWQRPDGRGGVVLAGQPTRFATQQFQEFRALLVLAGLLALLSAAVATWIVSGRALRPLRRLAETADEIGRTGDLGRRLPPAGSRDLLGMLTGSFNGMLERLADSRGQLTSTLEGQRAFLAEVSHELRSPLTTIRSNAGFLRERPDAAGSDRAEALADIADEAERMSRLVDGLLTLARADAGEAVARGPVELGELTSAVERRARALGHELRTHVAADARVDGDAEALTRLVWILVENGLRHGGGDVDVAIARRGATVEIAVGDRGPGIPDDERERVFERFRRGTALSAEGTTADGAGVGLGLAIARRLAGAHGGHVRMEARAGGGTLAVVELPAGGPTHA